MPEAKDAPSPERLRRERDLYLGLLTLNSESDLESFLKRALALVTGITGAEKGYLELFDPDSSDKSWSCAVGFPHEHVERVRSLVSRGIIAEVIATGQSIVTPSALLDPRFRDRDSVQLSRIDAVLCAPIGEDPPRGALYLESSRQGDFFHEDHGPVELFTRHLAPLAEQFLRRVTDVQDPTLALRARLGADDFVGKSRALASLLRTVESVARLDVGLLIEGETGTGKTQVARLIHRNSSRASGPFVELNCATLQENLAESDLFGHVRGAFSGADRTRIGKVAAAEGGTLLLDEVAELTLPIQAKLLQLLQDQQYYPVGASRAVSANVRVIAATHVDLQQAMQERRFREDLYYRLQVIPVRVPSLAERREDIRALALHLCARMQRQHKLPLLEPSLAALRALESAAWPGNVRELGHRLLHAAAKAVAEGSQCIEAAHLFPHEGESGESRGALTFQEETRVFQARLLRQVLSETDWNITATARRLDLTRAHVYNLIRSFDLRRT